ncbi:MAG TPA: multiheme c-type cytochrome [Prolixibacteraceae bacterium]|nr:multiheme c-type cytochrome [Prolixibacteraceae bacterium]
MTKNKNIKIALLIIPLGLIGIGAIAFGSFYTYWNKATPDKTCASCHEIGESVYSQTQSAHRNLQCKECHGTALSNGWHSMREKGMMVVSHLKSNEVEDVRLGEDQFLEVINNCKRCHSTEYTNWMSGGHSMDYQHVFLNTVHNSTEQINFDCLRCHGMFFEGNVRDVVEPLSITGPWKLKDEKMATMPAIPCMACHQIHQDGLPKSRPDYSDPKTIFYDRNVEPAKVVFYDRNEKIHFPVSDLPKLNLWESKRSVHVSDDLTMRNCVQCHAPNAHHQAGTSDDRTPRGVHEGLSCIACHDPHSNDARNSCTSCHPAVSNCKLDVTKMNTSYADPNSPNNIHFVSCTDCHEKTLKK